MQCACMQPAGASHPQYRRFRPSYHLTHPVYRWVLDHAVTNQRAQSIALMTREQQT